MDSRTKPNPPKARKLFLYLPDIKNSASRDMAMKTTLTGTKQTMKRVEIMTTILATFWFLFETLSVSAAVDIFCHFACTCSFLASTIVQTLMTMKALKGRRTLLMRQENLSTCSRSSEYIRPTRVLFLLTENFIPRCVTRQSGAALEIRMTQTATMVTDTRFVVMILFTCNRLHLY